MPAATPVPDTAIVKVGLAASEVRVTVPLALPLDFGENVSVNVVLCEAFSEMGVLIPLIENALLLTESWEIDTADESALVIVTV